MQPGLLNLEKHSYLNRPNLEYIDQLYQNFRSDPESVEPQWQKFFEGVEFAQNLSGSGAGEGFSAKEVGAYNLMKTYRDYGHLKAKLDPLGLLKVDTHTFDLAKYGLTNDDLDKPFLTGALIGRENAPLREIIAFLEESYCGTISAQLAECREEVRDWFRREFENSQFKLTPEERKQIFHQLARTESLEKFIHTRYVGTKRFSIEGGDSMIPMLESLVQRGTAIKIEEIVIGMAHRGRVNVLANFMGKGLDVIFSEFDGTALDNFEYDGDVKYHLGFSSDKQTPHGNCHVSLAFNPSHLEVVNPVVCGMARAKQRRRNDTIERKKVVGVMIHGDAAFAGQGVVTETLQLSQLPGYKTGGSIHVIVNNQVGFTTGPEDARSTLYASDVSKSIKAPVILVNGDDVEACVRAMDMAARFRQEFGEDVVIDMICYRKYGHNEGDEPAFTQPVMYAAIKKHKTPLELYQDLLISQGVLSKDEATQFYQQKIDNLQKILDDVRAKPTLESTNAYSGVWKGLRRGTLADFEKVWPTATSEKNLKAAAKILTEEPGDFNVHPKLSKLIQTRKKMVEDKAVDWAMGELLAYGTLCLENHPVRLSGQDCKRGTFTHRQSVYFDEKTGEEYCPLANLNPEKGEFCVYNSSLSEMAVLGFEYGNSCSDPTYLTLWEAQFGDFANGAQIVIDQFLSSGEEKWVRASGLVLLLPHGYEGQGPEHSSARLERFLQLCAQGNMQVCNITTPANFFHALRRQIMRDFRKPLVVMSPKSLLRHPKVFSKLSEFTEGHFHEVIGDSAIKDPKKIEHLILCSGKLYYELEKAREEKYSKRLQDTAIVRIEQLYPFPKSQLNAYLNGFPKLNRVTWAQEEPKNMGAWHFIRSRLEDLREDLGLKKLEVEYVGRAERASPATGSGKVHAREQEEILKQCLQD